MTTALRRPSTEHGATSLTAMLKTTAAAETLRAHSRYDLSARYRLKRQKTPA